MLDARAILRRFASLYALLLVALPALSGTVSGRVVGVSDGDTLTVLDPGNVQHKIRLKGLDAPEKGQPFGQAAKRRLSDLAFGQTVTVETSGRPDKYGREVGTVYANGRDVNAEMVSSGYAWAYTDATYSGLEADARTARLGLWADPNPEKPASYRKRRGIGYHGGKTQTPPAKQPPASAGMAAPAAAPVKTAGGWRLYAILAAGILGPLAIATICKMFSKGR